MSDTITNEATTIIKKVLAGQARAKHYVMENEIEKLLCRFSYSHSKKIVAKIRELAKKKRLGKTVFAVIKLPREFTQEKRLEYNRQVKDYQSNRVAFDTSQIDLFIEKCLDLLKSNSYMKKVLGLCGLTGRRRGEVLITGQFHKLDCQSEIITNTHMGLDFIGQEKSQKTGNDSKPCIRFAIPCLTNASVLIETIEELRKLKPLVKENTVLCANDYETWYQENIVSPYLMAIKKKTHNASSKEFNKLIKKEMGEFLPIKYCNFHGLRSLYACISYFFFTMEQGESISQNYFYSKALGHNENDIQTCLSYDKFFIE